MLSIEGTVKSIVFHNAENGYTVMDVMVNGENKITCVGILPIISVGEEVELMGEFIEHAKFGKQFSVKDYKVTTPKTLDGIVKYLSSGLIKGLGPVSAQAIVNEFGKNSLDILANNPLLLSRVRGISAKKAKEIGEQFAEIKDMQQQVVFLQGHNISLNLSIKIYQMYKDNTQAIVLDNPYILVDDIEGVGFITADKIATSVGIKEDSDYRIRAGLTYALKESADRGGNTYITEEELHENVKELLKIDISQEKFNQVLDLMMFELSIKRMTRKQKPCVSLLKYFNMEKNIANRLVSTKFTAFTGAEIEDMLISHFEEINRISFHIDQKKAIKMAIANGVTVITGGPGTGKTTIIKCICYIFHTLKIKVECVTPTGRAAKRMQQATGEDAKTIHRALDLSYKNGVFFTKNENNPLDAGVVIVDEMSMVDAYVFNALLKAVKQGARIILVGDKDQLPSVGAGNILADIIKSGVIPICSLSYIYRQSNESLIVSNAHRINDGELPLVNNKSKDFFFISCEKGDEIAKNVCQLVADRLPSYTKVDSLNIQVLAPMKAGEGGVTRLNEILQERLNPSTVFKEYFLSGGVKFRLGDKVMQTQNDYQMEWRKEEQDGSIEFGEGVFNGDMGIITGIYKGTGIQVTFEDKRVVEYNAQDIQNIMLSYAVTIHKSQGSEFDVVVIALSGGPPSIINKNLLYTAVTRAKKTVVLVGDYKKHLARMVKTNYIVERNTLLCEFLISEQEQCEKLYGFSV